MKRLTFDAPEHHLLNEGGQLIPGGGEFTVTDERAEELLTDPHLQIHEAPDSGLVDLTRTQLNASAIEAGVEQPDRLPNKDAVIAAINNAQSAAANGGEGHDDPQGE